MSSSKFRHPAAWQSWDFPGVSLLSFFLMGFWRSVATRQGVPLPRLMSRSREAPKNAQRGAWPCPQPSTKCCWFSTKIQRRRDVGVPLSKGTMALRLPKKIWGPPTLSPAQHPPLGDSGLQSPASSACAQLLLLGTSQDTGSPDTTWRSQGMLGEEKMNLPVLPAPVLGHSHSEKMKNK